MRRRTSLPTATLIGSAVTTTMLLARRWQLRWGATAEDVRASLPGDEILAEPDLVATRAITIRAPAVSVWPWLAQLGQGRGGFYSYDALENLIGCNIHSVDRIVPEWQEVKAGDEVMLAPEVGLAVAAVQPQRSLVLRSQARSGPVQQPYEFTWAFVLVEQPDDTTRLLVRERYTYVRRWAPLLVELLEAISFVMTQRMLRGIRDRAERATAR